MPDLVTRLTIQPFTVYRCDRCGSQARIFGRDVVEEVLAGFGPKESALWVDIPVRNVVGMAPSFAGHGTVLCGKCHRAEFGRCVFE